MYKKDYTNIRCDECGFVNIIIGSYKDIFSTMLWCAYCQKYTIHTTYKNDKCDLHY